MSASNHEYLPPISFAELYEAGRLSLPGADAYAEGYGPLGDPCEPCTTEVDELEAFVAAWAGASPGATGPLLPKR